jgi:hypothetical protein
MIPLAESCCVILTPAMIKAVRRVNIGHLGNMAVLVAVIIWEHVIGMHMVQNIGRIVVLATRRAKLAREAVLKTVKRVTRRARRRTFTTVGWETTVINALRTHTAITGTIVILGYLARTRVRRDQV